MNLDDFSRGAAWAIVPEALDSITRLLAETAKTKDLTAMAADFKKTDQVQYEVVSGVAQIKITGPITKRSGFLSWLFGATSVDDIASSISAALADRSVDSIALLIDSPGGTVSGISGVSDLVYSAREVKPIVAFSSGTMASAAYWVGSAASRIVVESAAQVGSIGVLMVHNDFSAMDQRIGIKTTYLTAGYYKAMGNDAEPLTDEAKAYFQQQLDHIYGLFSSAVARNRGASEKKVKTDMADGRLFIGSQAVDAGLADEIGSMSTAVNYLMEESRMKTVAEVKEKCPDLVAQIEEEAKKAGMIEARQETETAIKGATDRLLALVDVHFGTEGGKTFRAIVASGATAEMYAAIKAVQPANHDAEAEAKAKMLAAIQAAGPPAVGSDVPPAGGEKPFETLVAEHMAANPGEKKSAAMQAVQKANPAAYETWLAGKQKK